MATTLYGLIEYDFPAGDIVPKSEEKEYVLAEVLAGMEVPASALAGEPANSDDVVEDGDQAEPAEVDVNEPPPEPVKLAVELEELGEDPRLGNKATRDELVEVATERGLDVPDGATKADIRQLIDAASPVVEEGA